MDPKELEELSLKQSEKILKAIKEGDREKAIKECESLPKEFILVHKGLARVVEYILQYNEKVFREEQQKISEKITEKVKAGDYDGLEELFEEREKQHRIVHDLYIEIMAASFSYMGEVYGDERLEGILRYTGEMQKKGFEAWENMEVEDFVRMTAHLLKTHMGKMKVIEDDEKFTFIHDPCGSGGRLLREGAYDPPKNYYRVKDPKPIGYNRPNFPAYCSHCMVWNNIQCIEWFGHPQWIHEPPEKPEDPCIFHIYKDPSKIPAEYYEKFGKRK
ncbi:MAG: hypothetical protein D6734_10625 [Candidatus Schekmanbacteria bacterium]|nr:MAG: hypothetical protein D6734_10625 [Candidatus Schekmanbacteria bacterium]